MYNRRAPRHIRGTPRSGHQRRSARPQIRCVPSTTPSLIHTDDYLHRQRCDTQGRQGVRSHRRGPRTRDPGRTYAHGAPAPVHADHRDTRGSRCAACTGSVYIDHVIPRGSNALVRTIQHSTRIPVMGHAARGRPLCDLLRRSSGCREGAARRARCQGAYLRWLREVVGW